MNALNIRKAIEIENALFDEVIMRGMGSKARSYALCAKGRMEDTDTREYAALDAIGKDSIHYGYNGAFFDWCVRLQTPLSHEVAYGHTPKDAYKVACRMARTHYNYGVMEIDQWQALFCIKEYGSMDFYDDYLTELASIDNDYDYTIDDIPF